jgi:hypothetical protein
VIDRDDEEVMMRDEVEEKGRRRRVDRIADMVGVIRVGM